MWVCVCGIVCVLCGVCGIILCGSIYGVCVVCVVWMWVFVMSVVWCVCEEGGVWCVCGCVVCVISVCICVWC